MDKGIHLLLFNVRAENGASGYSRQIKIGHKKFRQDLLDLQSFLTKFWVNGDCVYKFDHFQLGHLCS